jgi:hypothetical protein
MEHLLHTLIAIWVLIYVSEKAEKSNHILLIASGLLLGSIRFEGLLEIGVLSLWLWKGRAWSRGLVLGIAGILPTLILGVYSLEKGWFFLPNSLILKAYGMNVQDTEHVGGYVWSLMMKAANHPHAIAAAFALYLLPEWGVFKNKREKELIYIVLIISVLHFLLARYNHVYRYEAYLMGLSWIVCWKQLASLTETATASALFRFFSKKSALALLILILLFAPFYRSFDSYATGTRAMCNIFDQQVQMARFIQSFYPTETVGVLDIGALAYYSDCKVLDFWGLASMDFATLKLNGMYTPVEIDRVCKEQKAWLAVIYGNKVRHPDWKIARSWALYQNVVCASDTISFVCLNPQKKARLIQNLHDFEKTMPASVRIIKE